ncbi:MAG: hypothetical protein ACI91O_001554 [Candidatus Poriferisodalaceae bacterium]|jgi:hypothetical protein
MDNTPSGDFEPTSSIEPIPVVTGDVSQHSPAEPAEVEEDFSHLGLMKVELPIIHGEPYRGTAFWRRIVAVLGLGLTAIVGGLVIAALIGAMMIGAAIVIEMIIS